MPDQYCQRVRDTVPKRKCNACNKDLVERTGTCCRYISCIDTCDYKGKEGCKDYRAAVARRLAEETKKRKAGGNGQG